MSSQNYSIVVGSSHIEKTAEIAKDAGSTGFVVDDVMPEIGAIFGHTSEADVVDRIRAMTGVEEIRPSQEIKLPPFDESIPQ